MCTAQKSPYPCHPGIAQLRPKGLSSALSVGDHRAQLDQAEDLFPLAHPLLEVEDGTRGVKVQSQGDEGEQKGKKDEPSAGEGDIKAPLEKREEATSASMVKG